MEKGKWMPKINMAAFEKDNSSTKVKEEKIIELTKVVKEKKKEHQNLEEKADNLETQLEMIEDDILKKRAYNRALTFLNIKEEAAINEFEFKFI